MKKLFPLCLCFFSTLFMQAQASKDEKAILDILNQQAQAWSQGKIDAFMQGYWQSDSLMFIGKNGLTYGYQNTLSNYKKNYGDAAAMGKLFFDILQVKRLSQNYYWVLGKWFLKRSQGDLGGHFTLLFKKIKGHWLIVADHSS